MKGLKLELMPSYGIAHPLLSLPVRFILLLVLALPSFASLPPPLILNKVYVTGLKQYDPIHCVPMRLSSWLEKN